LHEGGYRIRRDYQGERYFVRADGRAIPRCGYLESDSADDYEAVENPSVEGSLATIARSASVSAEIREDRGVYRLRPMCSMSSA